MCYPLCNPRRLQSETQRRVVRRIKTIYKHKHPANVINATIRIQFLQLVDMYGVVNAPILRNCSMSSGAAKECSADRSSSSKDNLLRGAQQ